MRPCARKCSVLYLVSKNNYICQKRSRKPVPSCSIFEQIKHVPECHAVRYSVFERVLGAVKDTRTNAHLLNAAIWMQNAKAPPPIGVPTKRRSVGSRRKNFRWGHNEHALWGKGATAREQTESRFYKRLSCSLARIATPERTKTHVSTMTVALTKQFACSYTRLLSAIFR